MEKKQKEMEKKQKNNELMKLMTTYMATAKNLYDGKELKKVFSTSLSNAKKLGDEAAIEYFSALLSRREDIANNMPALKALTHFQNVTKVAKKLDDPVHISIFSLTHDQMSCGIMMNMERFPESGIMKDISKAMGASFSSRNDVQSYAESLLIEGINQLLSTSYKSLEELSLDIKNVQARPDTLPEALSFCLTAAGDFLGKRGMFDASIEIFRAIGERIDPGYYAAKMQYGKLLWNYFKEKPNHRLVTELIAVYEGLLELVWSKRLEKSARNPMEFVKKNYEDRDSIEHFIEQNLDFYPTSEPFEFAATQLSLALNARGAFYRTTNIAQRGLWIDATRIANDRTRESLTSARKFL